MHGCLCEWERGTWHSSCPTCRGSTDSWALGAHRSPSSSAHLHISTDLPPPLTPSPSLSLSISLWSLLFNTNRPNFCRSLSSLYAIFTFHYVHLVYFFSSPYVFLFCCPLSCLLKFVFRSFFLFLFFFVIPMIVWTHSLGILHQAKKAGETC